MNTEREEESMEGRGGKEDWKREEERSKGRDTHEDIQ